MGIIYIILFAAFAIVLMQNYSDFSYPISLKFFYLRTPPVPVGVWFVVLFVAGYIIGYARSLPAWVKEFSKSREVSKLRKKIEELEARLSEREKETFPEEQKIEIQSGELGKQISSGEGNILSGSQTSGSEHNTKLKAHDGKSEEGEEDRDKDR